MRLTEYSRFPHPVLTRESNDFSIGGFDVAFSVIEKPETGALTIDYQITLTEREIQTLVASGRAVVGCFVECQDTYFTELRRLSWPRGIIDFAPGALLHRVTLRPFIWPQSDVPEWHPEHAHPEFEPPLSVAAGDPIAIGPEYVLSVGQAKFAPLESIFELRKAENVPDGYFKVDPDADRIAILTAPDTFDTISLLREQRSGLPLLLNAIYLPAVMEVLDIVRAGSTDYSDRRWYSAFSAKCDAKGIDLESAQSLLETAQELLEKPAQHLRSMLTDAGGDL